MFKKKYEIDWVDFDLFIDHDAEKLSEGSFLYSNQYLESTDDLYKLSDKNCSIKYKPKLIGSSEGKYLKITHKKDCINISGNLYKWLNSQNVTGESCLMSLILKTVSKLSSMGLVFTSNKDIEKIKSGSFRVYRVDVKQDLIFQSREEALRYLNHIIKIGYFPYKKKSPYNNGAYFGMGSKTRWTMVYYHKGTELKDKNQRFSIDPEIYQVAERMVRSECRILNAQLKDWNLMYAKQWADLEKIESFFDEIFSRLRLPNLENRNEVLDISNKNDRKFFTIHKNACIEDYYSRTTIHLMHNRFLSEYGIDLRQVERNGVLNGKSYSRK